MSLALRHGLPPITSMHQNLQPDLLTVYVSFLSSPLCTVLVLQLSNLRSSEGGVVMVCSVGS